MISQLNIQLFPNHHLVADQDFSSGSLPKGRPPSITAEFLNRDAVSVARDLIGATIKSSLSGKIMSATITEVAAYPGENDPDTHPYRNPKGSAAPQRAPGSLYVYSVQGHAMFTIATPPYSEGGCVLIRAVRTESGEKIEGPGKVSKALGIDTSLNGKNIFQGCGIVIDKPADASKIEVEASPRGKNSRDPNLQYRFREK